MFSGTEYERMGPTRLLDMSQQAPLKTPCHIPALVIITFPHPIRQLEIPDLPV